MRPAVSSNNRRTMEKALVESMRCALHLEFPLLPLPPVKDKELEGKKMSLSARGFQPKRIILLSITAGPKGARGGCTLLETALSRGWDVVFIEGYHGPLFRWGWRRFTLKLKYEAALKGLQMALKLQRDDTNVRAEETLVVFADAYDVLVQQTPSHVATMFGRQGKEFVWSSEGVCFPYGVWPYSLGVPLHTCDNLYPKPDNDQALRKSQAQFVNTGGWIGIASSALVVLRELSDLVSSATERGVESCYNRGTDQLLGNAAFLGHRELLGLDSEGRFFASSPPNLFEDGTLKLTPGSEKRGEEGGDKMKSYAAYCTNNNPSGKFNNVVDTEAADEESSSSFCPAFLHFNGGAHGDAPLLQCVDEILTDWRGDVDQNPLQCTTGTATILDIDTGTVSYAGLEGRLPNDEWPCGSETFHPRCSTFPTRRGEG